MISPNIPKYKLGWSSGLPETKCGIGSRVSETKIQRKWIPEMVAKYGIRSIADIGAGDLNWIGCIDLDCDYTPYDLVVRHPSVIKFDLLADEVPKVDCLMVLWVINHLPGNAARLAMNNLVNSGSKYLMMTWNPRMWEFMNLDYIESVVIRKQNAEVLHVDERGDVEIRLIGL